MKTAEELKQNIDTIKKQIGCPCHNNWAAWQGPAQSAPAEAARLAFDRRQPAAPARAAEPTDSAWAADPRAMG